MTVTWCLFYTDFVKHRQIWGPNYVGTEIRSQSYGTSRAGFSWGSQFILLASLRRVSLTHPVLASWLQPVGSFSYTSELAPLCGSFTYTSRAILAPLCGEFYLHIPGHTGFFMCVSFTHPVLDCFCVEFFLHIPFLSLLFKRSGIVLANAVSRMDGWSDA